MTYEQFVAEVRTLTRDVQPVGPTSRDSGFYFGAKKSKSPPMGISVSHRTGGYEGGSCWDDSDPQPFSSDEPMPPLTALDQILKHFCPTLSFLAYRSLEDAVVKTFDYTVDEYYGNSDNYTEKYVVLEELYDFLVDRKLLPV